MTPPKFDFDVEQFQLLLDDDKDDVIGAREKVIDFIQSAIEAESKKRLRYVLGAVVVLAMETNELALHEALEIFTVAELKKLEG